MSSKSIAAASCLCLALGSCAFSSPGSVDGRRAEADPSKIVKRQRGIWRRLQAGFRMDLSDVHDNAAVNLEIENYQRYPRNLQRALERAEPYLYYVINELKRRRMPTELALLPVVESAYDPFAYSSGRASGIWQFIPSTASFYQLDQNWWYDGRRDVRDSTDAALRYLQDLYEKKTDWPLALASYNAGFKAVSRPISRSGLAGVISLEEAVSRPISRNRRRGLPTRFLELRQLPKETRIHVPRFFALVKIVSNPEAYGFSLPPIADAPYFRVVNVGTQINLAKAAELAGVGKDEFDEFKALNAGFIRPTTPPQGPHELLLPIANAKLLERALKKWKASSDKVSDSEKKASPLPPAKLRPRKDLEPPSFPESWPFPRRITYKVRRNDSLRSIATAHGIRDPSEIARWNEILPQTPLSTGQKLTLWVRNIQ